MIFTTFPNGKRPIEVNNCPTDFSANTAQVGKRCCQGLLLWVNGPQATGIIVLITTASYTNLAVCVGSILQKWNANEIFDVPGIICISSFVL